MKKYLSIITIVICSILLVGCGNDSKKGNKEVDSNSNEPESNVVESNSNIEPTSNEVSNTTEPTSNIVESNSNVTTSNVVPSNSNVTTSNVVTSNSNVTTQTSNTTTSSAQKLSCSMDMTEPSAQGIKTIAYIDANFSNNKIQSVSSHIDYELPSNFSSQIDALVSNTEAYAKQLYPGEHFKVSVKKISATKFSVIISIDYKNMTAAEKTSLGIAPNGDESYAINKAGLEQAGFTCK